MVWFEGVSLAGGDESVINLWAGADLLIGWAGLQPVPSF